MTSVSSPLPRNPAGPTALVGYEPNLDMFAGFDVDRHSTFTAGSPSVQIDIRTLHQALQDGLAFARKENGELAIGIRPDQFVSYLRNAHELHWRGRDSYTCALLTAASKLQQIRESDLEGLTAPRRRIIQEVARLARSASFRQQVLQAYDNRCAVTRVQLRLVDAAHILPVGASGSSDHVRNGIALSPTYHRAFDQGLIYLDPNYDMLLNAEREASLRALNLYAGVRSFAAALGRIHLPPDRRQWPDVHFIQRANRVRRIAD